METTREKHERWLKAKVKLDENCALIVRRRGAVERAVNPPRETR